MKIVIVNKQARGIHRIVFGLCNIADGMVNIFSLSYLQSSFALDYAKYTAKKRIIGGICELSNKG